MQGFADTVLSLGGNQEMGMIGHQYIAVNRQALLLSCLLQAFQVKRVIAMICKDRLSIVATLDNMLRLVLDEITWQSSHGMFC